jgi:hypothetical protein
MSLEDDYVLERVRELLGASCDPQLRLVSKRCNAVMEKVGDTTNSILI